MLIRGTTENRCRNCSACRILYCNPHMAQRMELLWQLCQEFVGRELVIDEFSGIANQKLRKPHGRIHLDTNLCAGPRDGDAACDKYRQDIDEKEGQKQLAAQRASIPARPQQATPRAGEAQRCNRRCGLRGNARPPPGPMASCGVRKAIAQALAWTSVTVLFRQRLQSPFSHSLAYSIGGAMSRNRSDISSSFGTDGARARWRGLRAPCVTDCGREGAKDSGADEPCITGEKQRQANSQTPRPPLQTLR